MSSVFDRAIPYENLFQAMARKLSGLPDLQLRIEQPPGNRPGALGYFTFQGKTPVIYLTPDLQDELRALRVALHETGHARQGHFNPAKSRPRLDFERTPEFMAGEDTRLENEAWDFAERAEKTAVKLAERNGYNAAVGSWALALTVFGMD